MVDGAPRRERPKLWRILLATAEVVVGWLLIRHAAKALDRVKENPADKAFYDGKVASARFFAKNVLPGLTLTRKLVENSSLELMDLAEESF